MLGEKVGTFTGTTTDKVMPAQGGLPSFETSAQTSGKLAGAECQSMATYSAQMQPDGSLYGECPNSGVVMTSDGVATFRATGCGQMTGDGGAKLNLSREKYLYNIVNEYDGKNISDNWKRVYR